MFFREEMATMVRTSSFLGLVQEVKHLIEFQSRKTTNQYCLCKLRSKVLAKINKMKNICFGQIDRMQDLEIFFDVLKDAFNELRSRDDINFVLGLRKVGEHFYRTIDRFMHRRKMEVYANHVRLTHGTTNGKNSAVALRYGQLMLNVEGYICRCDTFVGRLW